MATKARIEITSQKDEYWQTFLVTVRMGNNQLFVRWLGPTSLTPEEFGQQFKRPLEMLKQAVKARYPDVEFEESEVFLTFNEFEV